MEFHGIKPVMTRFPHTLVALVASYFLGALPPVNLHAVCFVGATVQRPPYLPASSLAGAQPARGSAGIRE